MDKFSFFINFMNLTLFALKQSISYKFIEHFIFIFVPNSVPNVFGIVHSILLSFI